MYMKENFFDVQERKDIKHLRKLNEKVGWFKSIDPKPRFSESDATCYTTNNRKITVELKERTQTLDTLKRWGTVFIEPQKLAHLSSVMESGFSLNENCLYVNFTSDGHCIIFDFKKLDKLKFIPNHYHKNKGKGRDENESRIAIPIDKNTIII